MEDDIKKTPQRVDRERRICKTKQLRSYDTEQLFGDGREVRLRHCGEEYRLILTKNNKLILMK